MVTSPIHHLSEFIYTLWLSRQYKIMKCSQKRNFLMMCWNFNNNRKKLVKNKKTYHTLQLFWNGIHGSMVNLNIEQCSWLYSIHFTYQNEEHLVWIRIYIVYWYKVCIVYSVYYNQNQAARPRIQIYWKWLSHCWTDFSINFIFSTEYRIKCGLDLSR